MKKLLVRAGIVLSVAAMLAMLALLNCGLNEAGTVKVSIDSIDTVVIGSTSGASVYGTIESDSTITNVTMAIKDSAGTVLSPTIITAQFLTSGFQNRDSVDLFMNMQTRIRAFSSATRGTDTLVITVASGVITRKASHPFVVIP